MLFTNIARDTILIFTVSIISSLCVLSGTSGVGVIIPIYYLIGGFTLKQSIGFSAVTILGINTVRSLLLFRKPHPLSDKRYLINYHLLMLIVPFGCANSISGYMLMRILPSWLLLTLITLQLLVLFFKLIYKSYTNNKIENELEFEENNIDLVKIEGITDYINVNDYQNIPLSSNFPPPSPQREGDDTENIKYTIIMTTCSYLIIFVLMMLSTIYQHSVLYWIIYGVSYFVTYIYGYIASNIVDIHYMRCRTSNYLFVRGDIEWTKKIYSKCIAIGTIVGTIGILLGTDGENILIPFMYSLGMIPEVIKSTLSIASLFSALNSTGIFLWNNEIPIKYVFVILVCVMLVTVVTIKFINKIVEKYLVKKYITFSLSILTLLNIIIMVITGTVEITKQVQNNEYNWGFGKLWN